ncbi:MAG: MoaD/ThiS family protein [Chloroflexi bacterium]|nr:MoaD/ThiS family protein [Chloroflexota bacterium]
MSIEVRIPPLLRRYTDGAKSVQVDGGNVAVLLDKLDEQHPGIKAQLFTEDGTLHRFVNIYLNDEDIRFLDNLNTELADGDVVSILPAVAGGC